MGWKNVVLNNSYMNQPHFTVLIPNYNMGKFIEESIQSVLNQTYTNFELLIIDNCSTDESWEIINKYSCDNRVKIFRQVANIGMYANLNVGLMLARGKYLKIQCSDDLLHSSCLEILSNTISNLKNSISTPLYLGHEMYVGRVDEATLTDWESIVKEMNADFQSASLESYIALGLPNVCVDILAFKNFGGFGSPNSEKDFSRDLLMLGLFSQKCVCYQTKKKLVFERVHDSQNRFLLKKQWQLNELYQLYEQTGLLSTQKGKEQILELAGRHLSSSLKYLFKAKSFNYLFHTLKFSFSKRLVGFLYWKAFFNYSIRRK